MGKKHFCIPQNSSKTKKNKFYQYLYTYFHISGHSALEAGHLNDQAANISCPFLSESINFHAEWALKAPILLILACNMVFLIYIMAVSILKAILFKSDMKSWHQCRYFELKIL